MVKPHETLGWERSDDERPATAPGAAPRELLFARGELVSGRYEVRECLGEGAMGQVFEAHEGELNRRVALKAGYPHIDPAFLRREAQGLAAIRHPGVTTVHARGEHRGVPYFVMERLHGVTLTTHLTARRAAGMPMTLPEALDLLVQLADVLAAVHHAGVAHRDVKPGNVMLAVGGRTVLTDFGVVAEERAVDRHGPPVGTAEYMAPETIRGDVHSGLGFLVDVYAFGVLAFELLAGRLPFRADDTAALFALHLEAEVPVAELAGDTPAAMVTLLRELLEKDPLDRPQSMESVASRLRAISSRRSLRPGPPARR